jgi:hypothetical protein
MDICVIIKGWGEEDGDGGKEDKVKAQVSTTCVPWVLTIFIVWPEWIGVAMPWRAGIVLSWEDIVAWRDV